MNAERFTTPELKELEARILTAQERSGEIERKIFAELRRQLLVGGGAGAGDGAVCGGARFADVLCACGGGAWVDCGRMWMRVGCWSLWRARHPVVERRLEEQGGGRFVPNSLHLSAGAERGARGDL